MSKFKIGDSIISKNLRYGPYRAVITDIHGGLAYEVNWSHQTPTTQSLEFMDEYFELDETSLAKRILASYE